MKQKCPSSHQAFWTRKKSVIKNVDFARSHYYECTSSQLSIFLSLLVGFAVVPTHKWWKFAQMTRVTFLKNDFIWNLHFSDNNSISNFYLYFSEDTYFLCHLDNNSILNFTYISLNFMLLHFFTSLTKKMAESKPQLALGCD